MDCLIESMVAVFALAGQIMIFASKICTANADTANVVFTSLMSQTFKVLDTVDDAVR